MKYKEYLHTAQRHLATCRNFYDSINWTEASQWEYFKRFRTKKRIYEKENEKFLKKPASREKIAERTNFIEERRNKLNEWLERREIRLKIIYLALNQIDENLVSQEKTTTQAERIKLSRQKESLKKFNQKKAFVEETLHKLNRWLERRKDRLDIFDSALRQKGDDLANQDTSIKQMKKNLGNIDQLWQEDNLYKDIFYLSGYILEAFTVYLVYKNGGFSPEKDIETLDVEFSQKTHVDFYKTNRNKTKSARHEEENDCEYTKKLNALNKLIEEADHFYNIEGHKFFWILANVLREPKYDMILPSNSIPIFSRRENKQIENMIRIWGTKLTKLRYSSEKCCEIWDEHGLNPQTLKQLLNLCENIKNNPCCKL